MKGESPRRGDVPEPAVARLSLYLRHLELLAEKAVRTISSSDLGEAVACSAAQVRKDLGYFGQFGRPGVGYPVAALSESLRRILGTQRLWEAALVGVGNLGSALLAYGRFRRRGFRVSCAFDVDPARVGRSFGEVVVQHVHDFAATVRERGIILGIITVGAANAQSVADMMVEAGIVGILNFAPIDLHIGENIVLHTVDLAIRLEQITYHIKDRRR